MASPLQSRFLVSLKADWPYWAGGACLAVLNAAILLTDGKPWGITSLFTHVAGRGLQTLGLSPERWTYFTDPDRAHLLSEFGWGDPLIWLNMGVVAGALVSSALLGEWRWRPGPRGLGKTTLAMGGGVLMGYGARLALGCNVGALLGGIPSFSLHGWLFAAAALAGVVTGLHFLRRIL